MHAEMNTAGQLPLRAAHDDPRGPADGACRTSSSDNAETWHRSFTHFAIIKVNEFETLRVGIGYAASSEVMQEFGRRLLECVPDGKLFRVGRTTLEVGFSLRDDQAVTPALVKARTAIQRPVVAAGIALTLTASCGVTALFGREVSEEAVDQAAAALVHARPGNQFIGEHRERDDADRLSDFAIAQALCEPRVHDQFALHYQPKLSCRTDRIASAEALFRWHHPRHGAMPIERVIAVAERIGGIVPLTDWVVAEATAARATLAKDHPDFTIFVNLSGKLIADRCFIERLIAVALDSGGLGFEITETAVIDDPEDAIANVTRMSEAGIRVAIDDYGSGLSSLSYLKQLPAHELKIDRMFVRDFIMSHRDPLLVRSSIDLAHALDMEVTAEGVDDLMTLSLLRAMGCDMIQGYLIAKPMPLTDLVVFLAESSQLQGVGRALHALPATSEPLRDVS